MQYKLLSAMAVLLAGASLGVQAGPTVSGNTISWPDDGWYQVQRANDYTQVCAGGRSCVVKPGIYNVINHTTGERYTSIEVHAEASNDFPFTITGDTFNWPADSKWYQVQTIDTWETLCNGGSSCTVEPGKYTVLALDANGGVERYENVRVGDIIGSVFFLEGNTFSWPANTDWYQVQTSDTGATLCNGGESCTVEAGVYTVLVFDQKGNVDRFENIRVDGNAQMGGNEGDSEGEGNEVIDMATGDETEGLIRQQGEDMVLSRADRLISGEWLEPVFDWSRDMLTYLPERPTEVAIENNAATQTFDCPNGGSLTRAYRAYASEGTAGIEIQYDFDQCVDQTNDFAANGQLNFVREQSAEPSVAKSTLALSFNDFALTLDDENQYTIDNGTAERTYQAIVNEFCTTSPVPSISIDFNVQNANIQADGQNDKIVSGEVSNDKRVLNGNEGNITECYTIYESASNGDLQVKFSFAPDSVSQITSSHDITRDSQAETETAVGETRIEITEGESMLVTLISDEDRKAQFDVDSGGSMTSEVMSYDFSPKDN